MAEDAKVTLTAQVSQYNQAMRSAAAATATVGTEGQKLQQTRQLFDQIGRTSVGMGLAIGAGATIAVAKFAEFDSAMSAVAATGEDARGSMDALRAAALDAGASTVFSATESANAIEELAKAGLSASDILGGGLGGSLDLAAAGGLEVADAAGIAATALQQFGLEGDQASHVADLLAAGAGKAMGDVSDMGAALNQAGLVANQFGLSIEETVGTLSAFASAGMLGSDAGTSMRTMLLRLANPTEEVKDLMQELGIQAYDAGGEFVGLAGLAGELETGLAGMTQAQKDTTLAMIFGQDAIRGANILLREGSSGIDDWTAKVDDQGFAAEMAATKLDNLKGDLEALSGALDSAFIAMGSAADGPLRGLVQALTGVVDIFNDLPEGGQQAVFWVGALSAAAVTSYGAYLLLIPKLAEYNAALSTMGSTAQTTGRVLGAVGKGVGITAAIATAVTIAANALVAYGREMRGTDDAVAEATTTNQSFLDSMEALGITAEASGARVVSALDGIRNGENFGSVGFEILELRDALTELDGGLKSLPLEDAVGRFQDWGEELGLNSDQMSTMLDELPGLRDAIREHLTATGEAADAESVLRFAMEESAGTTEENSDALRELAGQAADTGDEVDGLAEQIRNFGSATLNVRDAQRGFEQALDDLSESIAANGTSLDITEQAGRDNAAALDEVAKSALEAAAATYEQSGSQEQANATIQMGRDRLIEMLGVLGITGAEADAYADSLGLIPGNVSTYVNLNTSDAEYRIAELTRARTMIIRAVVQGSSGTGQNVDRAAADGAIVAYANGGFPTGIYKGRPGSIHKFAEPETGWEAYISGKPSQKQRNIGIWQETGRRLGVQGFADGGITGGGIGGSVFSLSPEDRRLLRDIATVVNVNIGDDSVAGAANRGNANHAWREG